MPLWAPGFTVKITAGHKLYSLMDEAGKLQGLGTANDSITTYLINPILSLATNHSPLQGWGGVAGDSGSPAPKQCIITC